MKTETLRSYITALDEVTVLCPQCVEEALDNGEIIQALGGFAWIEPGSTCDRCEPVPMPIDEDDEPKGSDRTAR